MVCIQENYQTEESGRFRGKITKKESSFLPLIRKDKNAQDMKRVSDDDTGKFQFIFYLIAVFCSHQCLGKPPETEGVSPKAKRDMKGVPLTNGGGMSYPVMV